MILYCALSAQSVRLSPPAYTASITLLASFSPTWPGAMMNGRGFKATAVLAITTLDECVTEARGWSNAQSVT